MKEKSEERIILLVCAVGVILFFWFVLIAPAIEDYPNAVRIHEEYHSDMELRSSLRSIRMANLTCDGHSSIIRRIYEDGNVLSRFDDLLSRHIELARYKGCTFDSELG